MNNTKRAREAIQKHRARPKPSPSSARSKLPPGVIPPRARDAKMMKRPRLPDGSTYVAQWSEAESRWVASLFVPDDPATIRPMIEIQNETFKAGATGIIHTLVYGALFQLLEQLDKKHRDHIGGKK